MNQQNQNQNQPNYDFILNPQGQTPQTPNAPQLHHKKDKKFLIFAGGGLLLVLILGVVALAVSTNSNVRPKTVQMTPEEVSANFVNHMKAGEKEKIVNDLLSDEFVYSKETSVFQLERLQSSVNFDSCDTEKTEISKEELTTIMRYSCQTNENSAATLNIGTVATESGVKIVSHTVERQENAE